MWVCLARFSSAWLSSKSKRAVLMGGQPDPSRALLMGGAVLMGGHYSTQTSVQAETSGVHQADVMSFAEDRSITWQKEPRQLDAAESCSIQGDLTQDRPSEATRALPTLVGENVTGRTEGSETVAQVPDNEPRRDTTTEDTPPMGKVGEKPRTSERKCRRKRRKQRTSRKKGQCDRVNAPKAKERVHDVAKNINKDGSVSRVPDFAVVEVPTRVNATEGKVGVDLTLSVEVMAMSAIVRANQSREM
ncbi:hypothetical protein GQ457_18G000010 [Hibiscus cannabinus]